MQQAPVPSILVGKAITTDSSGQVHLLPKYGNRHGQRLTLAGCGG